MYMVGELNVLTLFMELDMGSCVTITRHTVPFENCGNIERTAGQFDLFSPLLSCFPYTLYTVRFQFIGRTFTRLNRQCPA